MKPDAVGFGLVVETDGAAVVRVIGELDCATSPRLRDEFIGLINRGIRSVTVDLARLDFIDSTGLGVLVSAMKRLREPAVTWCFSHPSRPPCASWRSPG